MPDTQLDPRTSEEVEPEEHRIDHVVCCDDHDRALCGEDVSELRFSSDDDGPICLMCAVRERTHVCPMYGACLGMFVDGRNHQ